MSRVLGKILAIVIFLGAITTAFADTNSVLGTVQLGKTIFSADAQGNVIVPVRFLVENNTQDAWGSTGSAPIYSYKVYFIPAGTTTNLATVSVASSNLNLTSAQNLQAGQSDVYAVGNITISNAKPGFYRVYVSAPTFKDQNSLIGTQATPSAGGSFEVQ